MTKVSVIFRTEPLTVDDYDDVINNLTDARAQLIDDELSGACGYCGGDDHDPNNCRHNPIVVAREAVANNKRTQWRCFHCDEVFSVAEEDRARAHFGFRSNPLPPVCFQNALRDAGIEFRNSKDDDGEDTFVMLLVGKKKTHAVSV